MNIVSIDSPLRQRPGCQRMGMVSREASPTHQHRWETKIYLFFLKMASLLFHIHLSKSVFSLIIWHATLSNINFLYRSVLFCWSLYPCIKPTPSSTIILFYVLIASYCSLILWFKMFVTIQADSSFQVNHRIISLLCSTKLTVWFFNGVSLN